MEIINKYLAQVDLIDYYITKNITELVKIEKDIEVIKNNIFLLGFNNKNKKNSLLILLESKSFDVLKFFINYNPEILMFRVIEDNTLFKCLLAYDYFYDYIDTLINELNYNFIIKLITEKNIYKFNFIDNIISILFLRDYLNLPDENKKEIYSDINKIVKIIKSIYLLDNEKKTLLITKLCKKSNNSKILSYILLKLDINYFDLFPDDIMNTAIDYLVLNDDLDNLKYLVERVNYIYIVNMNDNNIFTFLKKYNPDDILKIILMMIKKSNISKLKNDMNRNIFFELLSIYKIDIQSLNQLIKYVDIYEQDIDGNTLYNLINIKYTSKEKELIILEKNSFKYPNIDFKKILIHTDYGLFSSDLIHNMIYTIIILKKYKNLIIPYKVLSEKEMTKINFNMYTSNNEKNILGYLKIFYDYCPYFAPYLIFWINKFNYWIDDSLINFIENNKKQRYIMIKLSIYLVESNGARHANIIIIDNVNKVIERFEPYGEINFTNSNDLNYILEYNLAKKLKYKFNFAQPFPGFQKRSNETDKYNKSYGDPFGYCLAWCFLYVEIKMQLSKTDVNPIDVINYYIINKFSKEFKKKKETENKYMRFIRYYGRFLDECKNNLMKKYDIERSIIYQENLNPENQQKIIGLINKDLMKICKINI